MSGTDLLLKVHSPILDNAKKKSVETKGKTEKITIKKHKGSDYPDTPIITIQVNSIPHTQKKSYF